MGFVCALSMITYLDRVCFGSAVSNLVRDLGLSSEADLKWAFTAFAFAYAAFEIPSGWLGDVYGPRRTLIRIVLWWSFFTALTGAVGWHTAGYVILPGLGTLIAVRFLFGMGEAGAYPNITRALHNWFPLQERGVAQGAVWMAGRLMGGLTPFVWLILVDEDWLNLNWRYAFWLFGVMGVGWCLAFSVWFRNKPEENAGVNQGELDLIRAGRSDREAGHAHVPWGKIFSSPNLWLLCLMYFCAAYGWYFNITYLPRFLEEQYPTQGDRGLETLYALYKGGPLWMGAIACLLGGWLSDRVVRKTGNLKWGRRLFGICGHSLCALCYFLSIFTGSATTFFLAVSFAAFFNDMTMGPAWATCQDIGKRYAAIVAGAMNTIGNLGGAVAGWATGTILEKALAAHAAGVNTAIDQLSKEEKAAGMLVGYNINFAVFAGVYVLAVFFWLRIDATRPVIADEAAPQA